MARKFLTALDLAKNELQNAAIQNLATAPSAPVKGQLYFNSTGGDNTLYWWDGTGWIPAKATGGAFPGYGSVPAETTFGIAKADGASTTVARSDHTHGSPTHDAAAHSTIPLSALAAAAANISMGGFKITNVGTPTTGTDATNKDYVDNLSAGLSWKEAVRAATTANITLSAPQTVDGVAVIANERVLVKNQSAPAANGIYTVAAGAWVRATDADAAGELEGAAVFVMEGTTQADQAWVCTTNAPITPGTTATTWAQFGAGTAYTAGAGLTLTGSTFDVVGDASITVAADSISRAALTGDVTATAGANATTIANDAVTNAKLANMAANSIKGNNTGSAADPLDLTAAQVKTLLAIANTDVSGLGPFAPASKTTIVSADITDGTVANGDLANMPANTFKGNNTGSAAAPQDVTIAALKTALGTVSKYAITTIGGATSQVVTHSLNTQAVVVNVYRTLTPWDTVECDIERTTVNTVTLRFAAAPAANEYSCVVVG